MTEREVKRVRPKVWFRCDICNAIASPRIAEIYDNNCPLCHRGVLQPPRKG